MALQCRAITKSTGNRCSRSAVSPEGFCTQHEKMFLRGETFEVAVGPPVGAPVVAPVRSPSPPREPDKYSNITTPELVRLANARGAGLPINANRAQAIEALERLEAGGLLLGTDYANLSTEQLITLAKQRGIATGTVGEAVRRVLIRQLQLFDAEQGRPRVNSPTRVRSPPRMIPLVPVVPRMASPPRGLVTSPRGAAVERAVVVPPLGPPLENRRAVPGARPAVQGAPGLQAVPQAEEKYVVYGIIGPDQRLRLSQMIATPVVDLKLLPRGKICNQWAHEDLVRVAVELGVPRDKAVHATRDQLCRLLQNALQKVGRLLTE